MSQISQFPTLRQTLFERWVGGGKTRDLRPPLEKPLDFLIPDTQTVNESGQIALFPLLPNDCNYRHTAASSYCSTAAWTVGHPIPTILRCIFLYSFGFYFIYN